MEATLHALGGILLKAIPTFILVLLLHAYLRAVFFGPLSKVLAKRYEATEGARLAAKKSLQLAETKTAEYEAALMHARGEIYREQEEMRKQWQADQDRSVSEARSRAQQAVAAAKAELEREAENARASIQAAGEQLAVQIAGRVLQGGRP